MAGFGALSAPAVMRVLRKVLADAPKVLRTKLASAAKPTTEHLQTVTVRTSPTGRHPIHPAALLRQQKSGRWFSTTSQGINAAFRRYLSSATSGAPRGAIDRTKFPVSATSRAVSRLPGRAPFASTLRPNLTGGALPRTAGGYAIPGSGRAGGARYFSHTPAAPAQVVQNVSQAMRAFWLQGNRAHFDGCDPNGERRYRAVSAMQDEATRRMGSIPRYTPGSFVEFPLAPTVTALSPLTAAAAAAFPFAATTGASLNESGFLDVLSVDFARALKDLAAVMNDLKRLSTLGDLPVALEKGNRIRVRFPGVDAETVERLCDDVGVQRGVVGQDPDFDSSAGVPMALRFPFAPDAQEAAGGGAAKALTSPGGSLRSHDDSDLMSLDEEAAFLDEYFEQENPWLSPSPAPSGAAEEEGYESMSPPVLSSGEHCSEDFEGLEGIYRFLEECDRSKDRF